MGRELQKRKNRSSVPKVTRRKNTRIHKVKNFGNSVIAENWDKTQTLSQNYARLGLASRLNASAWCTPASASASLAALSAPPSSALQPGEARIVRDPASGETKVVEYAPTVEEALDAAEDGPEITEGSGMAPGMARNAEGKTAVVRRLEAIASSGVKRERTQSEREVEWVQRLVEKHGRDYKAMARDRKLNVWQQTEGDIKRRIARWEKKAGKKQGERKGEVVMTET